jgi:hypothetical protein
MDASVEVLPEPQYDTWSRLVSGASLDPVTHFKSQLGEDLRGAARRAVGWP